VSFLTLLEFLEGRLGLFFGKEGFGDGAASAADGFENRVVVIEGTDEDLAGHLLAPLLMKTIYAIFAYYASLSYLYCHHEMLQASRHPHSPHLTAT